MARRLLPGAGIGVSDFGMRPPAKNCDRCKGVGRWSPRLPFPKTARHLLRAVGTEQFAFGTWPRAKNISRQRETRPDFGLLLSRRMASAWPRAVRRESSGFGMPLP